jgi:hypothetical protein
MNIKNSPEMKLINCALMGISPTSSIYKEPKYKPKPLKYKPKLTRITKVPLQETNEKFEKWLTGFWEGDGHCRLFNMLPHVSFAQKDCGVLVTIQEVLEGGNLSVNNYEDRGCSNLAFNGSQAKQILDIMSNHLVCPLRVAQINVLFSKLSLKPTVTHPPDLDWIVGFWDAEGSSYSNKNQVSALINICQKDREPLDNIADYLDCGKIYKNKSTVHQWCLGNASPKFKDITNYLLNNSLNGPKVTQLKDNLTRFENSKRASMAARETRKKETKQRRKYIASKGTEWIVTFPILSDEVFKVKAKNRYSAVVEATSLLDPKKTLPAGFYHSMASVRQTNPLPVGRHKSVIFNSK